MIATRPNRNVLLIYTDQWRYDALGCAGHPVVQTPNLDALAVRGTRFSHCFVQHPLCMPSRYSMLSGRYPSSLGVTHMGVPVPEDAEVLSCVLARFGYRTANIGKLHFLPHANRDHREAHPAYGFEHAEISDEPGVYPDAYRAWVQRHHPDDLEASAQVAHPPAWEAWQRVLGQDDGIRHPENLDPYRTRVYEGSDDSTHSAFVAERSIDYLRRRASDREPFFCISSFYNPHSPLVAPQRFLDLYADRSITPPCFPEAEDAERKARGWDDDYLVQAMRGYYAMISEVDHYVGQIIDALDAGGLSDNTLVIFTSDHGEFLGEHLRWGKGYPAPDCVLRVPCIMAGPGVAPGPSAVDTIIEAVDIFPTITDWLAVPTPPQAEGCSRLSLLQRHPAESDPSESALCEDAEWKHLRTRNHRYLLHRDGSEELYDVNAEHGEYHDISRDPDARETLAAMRHRLALRLLEKERPAPRVWPY
ncbi:sulfatase family protein [Mucisphaera calidilacus]|uniref:Arylsulfatase n=1 Tax=Mucisphaera calidilacus TaxID=2527982 RepID=A0A518BU93_9BACT|nr:sulfatase-like hydrolase/transferase [Mucisphaera calidilacus]QDU70521.1 Arylsulfatase [Mucisphaera calidilacus]